MMRKLLFIPIFLLSLFSNAQQDCLLEKKPVKDLVQDYANVLSDAEEQSLRNALISFNDTTSTQILIVTVTNLCGYDKAEFTYSLGEKWGVGQKGKDNGVVIMVKPKEIDGKGEVFIAPGYGLEGVLPDAIAKRITDNEMIPAFKQKEYYQGIAKAATIVMEITSGEYSAEEYAKIDWLKVLLPFLFIILVFVIVIASNVKKAKEYSIGHNVPFWTAFMLMSNSGRSHGGSFGNFSSGGGSFGGFGGGSFGGGGAGGSW